MSNELATMPTQDMAELFNKLVLESDLSKLSNTELVQYYYAVCQRAGLDPLTKPFDILSLNGKKTLYATKTAAAQLTKNHGLTVTIVDKGNFGDTYYVQARVTKKDGSAIDDIGVVSVANLRGEALSNAMMKATTKAKRRAILAAFGVGANDETEIEDLPGVKFHPNDINPATLAPMSTDETEALQSISAMIESAENKEQLTDYVILVRQQSAIVREALRPNISKAQERLNVFWKDGKFVDKITTKGN